MSKISRVKKIYLFKGHEKLDLNNLKFSAKPHSTEEISKKEKKKVSYIQFFQDYKAQTSAPSQSIGKPSLRSNFPTTKVANSVSFISWEDFIVAFKDPKFLKQLGITLGITSIVSFIWGFITELCLECFPKHRETLSTAFKVRNKKNHFILIIIILIFFKDHWMGFIFRRCNRDSCFLSYCWTSCNLGYFFDWLYCILHLQQNWELFRKKIGKFSL